MIFRKSLILVFSLLILVNPLLSKVGTPFAKVYHHSVKNTHHSIPLLLSEDIEIEDGNIKIEISSLGLIFILLLGFNSLSCASVNTRLRALIFQLNKASIFPKYLLVSRLTI